MKDYVNSLKSNDFEEYFYGYTNGAHKSALTKNVLVHNGVERHHQIAGRSCQMQSTAPGSKDQPGCTSGKLEGMVRIFAVGIISSQVLMSVMLTMDAVHRLNVGGPKDMA